MPPQKSVIELKFTPDEYLCTWHVPSLDGETLHLPGSVEVAADQPPRGTVYGKVPVKSYSNDGNISLNFPQSTKYKALKFTLANGGVGTVLNAQLEIFISQGVVTGAAVTMAKASSLMPWEDHTTKAPLEDEDFLFDAAEIQVSGLDSLMGVTPIGQKTHQSKKDEEGKFSWTSVTNPKSEIEWQDSVGNTLSGWYSAKLNTFDFYNVSIRFAPLLRLTLSQGGSLFEIVKGWLEPVRGIASIATGRSQAITYFALSPVEDESVAATAQVFGTALKQAPYESSNDQIRRDKSVLRCVEDGVNLLDLVSEWRRLEAEGHPLIQTYAGMLHVKDSHPRSRFLLLIQSLEGMYGHDTAADFEERQIKHEERRGELLTALADHLSSRQKRFLKKNLARDPARNLEDALSAAFDLPEDFIQTRATLEESRLAKAVMADQECTALGALRIARNGLAHGTRGFPAEDLQQVNDILDRLVRAHALRLLGCPDAVLSRLATPDAD